MVTESIKTEATKTNQVIKQEKEAERQSVLEAKGTIAGDTSRALDTFGQVIMGDLPTVFKKFGENIGEMAGNIVSGLGGHIGKNWDEDTKDFREALGSMFTEATGMITDEEILRRQTNKEQAEALADEFDMLAGTFVTEDPRDGVARNTLSDANNAQLSSVLTTNKHSQALAVRLRNMVDDKIIENTPVEQDDEEILDEQPIKETVTTPTDDNRGLP
jgi:hypothetical protein